MNLNRNEFFLLSEVVKKNFSAKYKDSTLGIIWTVLNPLLQMTILTIVFSTLFSRNIANYPVYVLSGKCVYSLFSKSCSVSLNAIRSNKYILTKTAAPKHIFIIGGIISEFINFIIELLLLIGVMFATNAPFYINTMPLAIIPVISAVIMAVGVGLILSICQVYYSDTGHIWRLFTMMLFYTCAIFYPMNLVREPIHTYLVLNPIFWLVDQFRDFYIFGTMHNLLNIVNSLLLSTIILLCGLIVYKKFYKKIAMKI